MDISVFFTQGVSLRDWENIGMLEREVALYRRLTEKGIGCGFVTYGGRGDLQFASHLSGIQINCNRWGLPADVYKKFLNIIHAGHLRKTDVIKSNQIRGADAALSAAKRFGKPFIARCGYLHSEFTERQFGLDSAEAKSAQTLEGDVFRGADRVVVTTAAMRERIIQDYGLDDARVRVIPNYVDTDLFRPEPPVAGSEKNKSRKSLCFIGRLTDQKNLFVLFDALGGLDLEITIIGEGEQRDALERKASALKIKARFLGNLSHTELPEWINRSDIFILPSKYEGHPKTLLEAMSCGKPVIGTDVSGIRELIHHRETGYICPPTAEGIREAVEEISRNQDLAAHMGMKARTFIEENFSLDRTISLEKEILEEVAAG